MERLLVLVAVVIATAVVSWLYRARQGRVTAPADGGDAVLLEDLLRAAGIPSQRDTTTLLEVTSPGCAACVPARRVLDEVAADRADVTVAAVDVTALSAEVLRGLSLLRAPTTLVIAADGQLLGRVGGVPRRDQLQAALEGRDELCAA